MRLTLLDKAKGLRKFFALNFPVTALNSSKNSVAKRVVGRLGFLQDVLALKTKCSVLGTCWSQDEAEGWGRGSVAPSRCSGRQGETCWALLGWRSGLLLRVTADGRDVPGDK